MSLSPQLLDRLPVRKDALPLHVADERIVIAQSLPVLSVDGNSFDELVQPQTFKVFSILASLRDIIVPYDELAFAAIGYDDYSARRAVMTHVSKMRGFLGPELGDPKQGAIRSYLRVGYCAVSSLSMKREDITEVLSTVQ